MLTSTLLLVYISEHTCTELFRQAKGAAIDKRSRRGKSRPQTSVPSSPSSSYRGPFFLGFGGGLGGTLGREGESGPSAERVRGRVAPSGATLGGALRGVGNVEQCCGGARGLVGSGRLLLRLSTELPSAVVRGPRLS